MIVGRLKGYLSQNSLFDETSFLIIKRDRVVPKREIVELIDLVVKGSKSYLIFHFLGTFSEVKPLLKPFSRDGAVWVRLFKPNMRDMLYMLEVRAKD